ncbi:hypothetical protein EXIGLDRAFT_133844 [Exidia glandulosa HHB12029]|uniref:Zn(2)-C6 fungal-type domain-containing protein n=1 Tax=Exidia glandulosa HHB12029 TaxID=1314781 RepID=A0A165NFL8_EXIGL|nr:hypothetical protein EXIGLDRAFT_133844 [Exidia glandulosa HHB12029]
MPKATTGQPSLRRNQACRQCRRRKLKCDAQRPHCSTCVKQWTAQISVPPPVGFSHPAEPACMYDPVEGVALVADVSDDPNERVRQLESQIAELQLKLNRAHEQTSRSVSPHNAYNQSVSPSASGSMHNSPPNHNLSPPLNNHSPAHGHRRISSAADVKPFSHEQQKSYSPPQEIVLPQVSLNVPRAGATTERSFYANIEMSPIEPGSGGSGTFMYTEILHAGWNRELPDPATLHHLVDAFFRCDPCGSRILHRPSFMASLALPPTHPDFPHSAVLHAICASASRWTSLELNVQSQPRRRDRFAEFHAGKARSYIDQTMVSGAQIFATLQACIILSWWFYAEGRWVEVWLFAGFQCRASVPLGLNYPNTHRTRTQGVYLEPPKNARDLELRRRAWWMALVFDRLVSVGGWPHAIDERDIGTELPLRQVDFDSDDMHGVGDNPQSLWTHAVLTTHPPHHTDPLLLLIKACMLFGRVTDYNSRSAVHNPAPTTSSHDRRNEREFVALDQLIFKDFLNNLPIGYRNCLGVGENPDGTAIDTDLYLVHVIPYAAAITLHSPHLDVTNPHCPSVARCMEASRQILNAYYLLTSTSFDITRLHPFIVTVWYLAAIVQVHYCKSMIQIGDQASEAAVWGEINLMRFALLQYGGSSSIGIRQEKMLRDSMTEILRMTTHTSPLSVTVPLYPWSGSSVFKREEDGDASGSAAPLPHPMHTDDDMPGPSRSPSMSLPMSSSIPMPVQLGPAPDVWQTHSQQSPPYQHQQQQPQMMHHQHHHQMDPYGSQGGANGY